MKKHEVVFAGNLLKSPFLQNLNEIEDNLVFNIYGEGGDELLSNQTNVQYKGVVDPYLLPGIIEGSFGLVWDGDSIRGLSGSGGEYLRYNSPHKLSLYIVSGLPIITHCDSAVAEFVIEYKIGICISNLFEISQRIESLTEEEYNSMISNMNILRKRIISGDCLGKALGLFA